MDKETDVREYNNIQLRNRITRMTSRKDQLDERDKRILASLQEEANKRGLEDC